MNSEVDYECPRYMASGRIVRGYLKSQKQEEKNMNAIAATQKQILDLKKEKDYLSTFFFSNFSLDTIYLYKISSLST